MNNKTVYLHRNNTTNQVFYVGAGSKNRPYSTHRSNQWHEYVAEYGYTVEIVKEDLSPKEADELEVLLISAFGRKDLGKGELLNKTNGGPGTGGAIVSEETRAKMRNSYSRTFPAKKVPSRRFSDEARANMTKAQYNRHSDTYVKQSISMRLRKMNNMTYLRLVDDIRRKLEGTYKISQCGLADKYNVSRRFIITHIKNVKENNILV
jgi:anti-sigma28 factor (negative regulator of flagellin synthesis)